MENIKNLTEQRDELIKQIDFLKKQEVAHKEQLRDLIVEIADKESELKQKRLEADILINKEVDGIKRVINSIKESIN